jgi:hypothetical protein
MRVRIQFATVYFMTSLHGPEPLMLAVNVREGRVEAAEQSCVRRNLLSM